MITPFIRNHQLNVIRKQAALVQQACQTVTDPKVVESVQTSAQFNVWAAFPDATAEQKHMLEQISAIRTAEEARQYVNGLEPYLTDFGQVTAQQLHKLFPKVKKLKTPDLAKLDNRRITYLGWSDIAVNKMFWVYPLNGRYVGIEGRFTPMNKGVCFLCNRHEQLVLFSAVTKTKPAKAPSDYYRAIGNYVCADSHACNNNITDVTMLEKFIREVTGM
ncbi:FusB/FusC family EF-G-binding protein [Paenibacillus sp. 1P07SE]|uniref:FusB/FusC family EF-G-binding protein n=1 Tax=Paenibacillus sp. 1P07SE TaxID=3132209 RepID=UPI0039A45360